MPPRRAMPRELERLLGTTGHAAGAHTMGRERSLLEGGLEQRLHRQTLRRQLVWEKLQCQAC
jgi:hypothetical protein